MNINRFRYFFGLVLWVVVVGIIVVGMGDRRVPTLRERRSEQIAIPINNGEHTLILGGHCSTATTFFDRIRTYWSGGEELKYIWNPSWRVVESSTWEIVDSHGRSIANGTIKGLDASQPFGELVAAVGLGEEVALIEIADGSCKTFNFVSNSTKDVPSDNRRGGGCHLIKLADGTILASGGQNLKCNLFNPTNGTWRCPQQPAPPLHSIELCLRDGRILSISDPSPDTELFDPTTGIWTKTGAMTSPREDFASCALSDGRVLISGGIGGGGFINSCEIYNTQSGTWSPTANLQERRSEHQMLQLVDGSVLAVGGLTDNTINSCERYDPKLGTWSVTGSLRVPRSCFTLSLLPNGQVLAIGGNDENGNSTNTCELYDPQNGQWTLAKR